MKGAELRKAWRDHERRSDLELWLALFGDTLPPDARLAMDMILAS